MVDANDYYPFGMNHLKTGTAYFGQGSFKSYKYNGKELQETGMYDYGARMYMADLGRWGVMDAMSEKSRRLSPYHYRYNNPVRFIDPDGRKPMSSEDEERNVMRKNAPDGSLWFTYANGEHGAGGGDGMGDFFAQMNRRHGGGGGSSAGGMTFTDPSMIAFIQQGASQPGFISGLFSMVEQLEKAGFKDPAHTKAKYSDLGVLLEKTPELKELFAITKAKFVEDCEIKSPAVTNGDLVRVNIDRMKNVLAFAFTLGHEMYGHVFANLFFADKFSEITHISKDSPRSFNFFQEVMGVSWEMTRGETRYGQGDFLETTIKIYGPQGLGHGQGAVDNASKYYDRLKVEYKLMYEYQKNKLIK